LALDQLGDRAIAALARDIDVIGACLLQSEADEFAAALDAGPVIELVAHGSPRQMLTADGLSIFLVCHVLHPLDMLAVERLLHRDMHHAGIRTGAVPMFLARRNPHGVARLDLADRSALGLHASDARYYMQR